MSGCRTHPCEKAHDLCLGDSVAHGLTIGVAQELAQQIPRSGKLCAMRLSPSHILLDCFTKIHANPSRSKAATSRSAARLTLA
jgi:hypothetical protein